ncbi:hypothetical protein GCM10022247_29300 [Allokutzneria multivorans]|uniref:Peptidase inhibitor family I36 n=1 Tax=Allokutzneria multivorans TaxID=1142134 RepID=A0ABP7S354_9PSEU
MRRALAIGLALAFVVGGNAAAHAAVAGYETCPAGKVCVYERWHGTGPRWDVPGCGWWELPSWIRNEVSSVRTHGNAMSLLDVANGEIVGRVRAHTATNLASWENERADKVHVEC